MFQNCVAKGAFLHVLLAQKEQGPVFSEVLNMSTAHPDSQGTCSYSVSEKCILLGAPKAI